MFVVEVNALLVIGGDLFRLIRYCFGFVGVRISEEVNLWKGVRGDT